VTPFSKKFILVAAILVVIGGVTLAAGFYVRTPRLTPELRGLAVATEMGCFACHGPAGTGGVPNPGSEEEDIPAWDGGNAMMYVKNEQEIREWILDGHPSRLAPGDGGEAGHSGHDDHDHPDGAFPLSMPAFKDVISDGDLEDLVAYYKAVAAFEDLPSAAHKGYRIAARLGCYGCHGPGGRVGAKNPASFKGYIPPWRGRDFKELVKNDEELRQWILEGKIDRFESNPLARLFTKRQLIQMPAYRDIMSDDELESLVAYVHWLNDDE
jgi:mono/diheme cytochrome c family protein